MSAGSARSHSLVARGTVPAGCRRSCRSRGGQGELPVGREVEGGRDASQGSCGKRMCAWLRWHGRAVSSGPEAPLRNWEILEMLGGRGGGMSPAVSPLWGLEGAGGRAGGPRCSEASLSLSSARTRDRCPSSASKSFHCDVDDSAVSTKSAALSWPPDLPLRLPARPCHPQTSPLHTP